MEKAVALLYAAETSAAPRVVASGRGELASRIVARAKEAGVQVVKDDDLLEILAQVPVGEDIPVELYQAVAEILAFVYQVNGCYQEDDRDGAGDT